MKKPNPVIYIIVTFILIIVLCICINLLTSLVSFSLLPENASSQDARQQGYTIGKMLAPFICCFSLSPIIGAIAIYSLQKKKYNKILRETQES